MNSLGVKRSVRLANVLGVRKSDKTSALGQRAQIGVDNFEAGRNAHAQQIYAHNSNSGDITWMPVGLGKHAPRHNGLERKHK
jgi:hypothetical protein